MMHRLTVDGGFVRQNSTQMARREPFGTQIYQARPGCVLMSQGTIGRSILAMCQGLAGGAKDSRNHGIHEAVARGSKQLCFA
jgi:hypothetical protein